MTRIKILAALLPIVIFLLGGLFLNWCTNRNAITTKLRELDQARRGSSEEKRVTMDQRLSYDASTFGRYLSAVGPDLLPVEQRFLKGDLLFPLVYGGALLASLVILWNAMGRPFHAGWLVLPVGLTIAADWTENVIQLRQIDRFAKLGEAGLQPVWIQVASFATAAKFIFWVESYVFVLVLICLLKAKSGRA
jgi:hypothetical protein